MTTRYQEKLTTLPDVPKTFGDDGGKFYRHYDELADELDEDLVKSLKAQLDGILIFAGLFAGVNSAFLAFTLPQMTADPADDTNALLLQILLGGRSSITSVADLPSASFTPPPRIYPINVLFSVSLTLALLSSFLAVLGQQWIVYYRKRSGGGPEHQRWEQLRRSLGAKRWRLELVLDGLVPSMLQLGLVIFGTAFSLYLSTMSKSLSYIIAAILCTALIVILAMTTCAAFDPWCPFKTPLSRSILPVTSFFGALVICLLVTLLTPLLFLVAMIVSCFSDEKPPTFNDLGEYLKSNLNYGKIFRKLMQTATRSADDPEYLGVEVIKRVMCVSEDRTALVHAATNLQTIRGHGPLSSLIEDKEFYSRLSELNISARDQWMSEQLDTTVTEAVWSLSARDPRMSVTSTQSIEARALFASFAHLWFSAGSTPDIDNPDWRDTAILSLEAYEIAESQFRRELIPSTPDCSRCSHCTTLWFCAKFARVMIARDIPRSTFSPVFKDVEGALTKSGGLRLGSVVASAILSSTMWGGAYPIEASPGGSSFRRSDRLAELMGAYREQSELEMVALVSRALATVNVDWMWKPSYGVYVRLFELGLCSEKGSYRSLRTPRSETPRILSHLGSILLSIEVVIRYEAASSADAQRGREHQNWCIQSAAENLRGRGGWFRGVWNDIGSALEPYLKGIKQQVETDPANPNNPSAIALLRRIGSSFPTFAPDDDLFPTFARDNGPGRPIHLMYSKFREFVDQIELLCQTRNNGVSEGTGNVVALRRHFLHMESEARESLETHIGDKENARLHTPSDMWGN